MRPFFVLGAKEKLGGKNIRIHFNRWLKKEKGYRNEFHWKPEYSADSGDLISAAWTVVGCSSAEKAIAAVDERAFGPAARLSVSSSGTGDWIASWAGAGAGSTGRFAW